MASSTPPIASSDAPPRIEPQAEFLPFLGLSLPSGTFPSEDSAEAASTSSRPLPSIPVEVLERILKYTFLRPGRLLPTSDPFNLNETSHLLLVSKGFRELCTPMFYHSVTISRQDHYVTFFDPEEGLFVAGEEGKRRWSFVRELSIVVGIEPPLSFHGTSSCLVPLLQPIGRTLQRFCLLNRTSPEDTKRDPRHKEVVARMMEDPVRRQAVFDEWDRQRFSDLELYPARYEDLSLEDWFETRYGDSRGGQLLRELSKSIPREIKTDKATFLHDLVRLNPPTSLIVGNVSIRSFYLPATNIGIVAEQLVLCSDSPDASHNIASFRSFIWTFNSVLRTPTVLLAGFSSEWTEELGRLLKETGDSRDWYEERSDGSRREIFIPTLAHVVDT